MKRTLRLGFVVVIFLVSVLSAFALGVVVQRGRSSAQIDQVQAMLWFNHLKQFQELEVMLSNGCTGEALEKVKIDIDQELALLSSFEKSGAATWIDKYISDRDPELLTQLKTFKSKYGNSWIEPRCEKK